MYPSDILVDDVLYRVAKIIAEEDSIGEGYGYCPSYSREKFEGNCDYKRVALDCLNAILDELGYPVRRKYTATISPGAQEVYDIMLQVGYGGVTREIIHDLINIPIPEIYPLFSELTTAGLCYWEGNTFKVRDYS